MYITGILTEKERQCKMGDDADMSIGTRSPQIFQGVCFGVASVPLTHPQYIGIFRHWRLPPIPDKQCP